jgi:hypothetical protein
MRHALLSVLGVAALALGTVAQSSPLTTELAYSGYVRPVAFVTPPGDPTRNFVVEQNQADIHVIVNGVQIGAPFLDLTGLVTTGGNEQGLLGLAFHPDYATNRFFYVNYTGGGGTRVVRYTRSVGNPNLADAGSAQQVVFYSQPQSNHNGGGLAFGTDGYLYLATGDGGNFDDQGTGHVSGGNAQSGVNLLGKMLRLDVDGDDFPGSAEKNYAIPATNPHVGDPTIADEIIYLGLRNPWRYSFDRKTGDLYIGDVGQNAREEVDYVSRADLDASVAHNFSWRCREGFACTGLSGCVCVDPLHTPPIDAYTHGTGFSITGGNVYRGEAIPDLDGTYFFADYQLSKLFSFKWDGLVKTEELVRTIELDPPGGTAINGISAFGEDANGEMYICDLTHGEIFRIIPAHDFLGIGKGVDGTVGQPILYGTGGLAPMQAGSLHVRNVLPNGAGFAFASLTTGSVPFYGGSFNLGFPLAAIVPLVVDAAGSLDIAWTDPGTAPSGFTIYYQFAFVDAGAAFGVSATNALSATVP